MNNDLISREALKDKLTDTINVNDITKSEWYEGYAACVQVLSELIDNAPSAEEITNEDIQQAIKEGFANGYEMAKEKIIHSIAKQYSEHNELVPMWLSIGDIKDGAE